MEGDALTVEEIDDLIALAIELEGAPVLPLSLSKPCALCGAAKLFCDCEFDNQGGR